MIRLMTIQTNFTAGEISPRLYGRTDLAKYANGARTLLNMVVQPHGGVTRRPGTRFVAGAKIADAPARLAPFQFSTAQAYILEFGERYIRFFANGSPIAAPSVGAGIVNGGFDDTIAGWSDASTGAASIAHAHVGEARTGTFGFSNLASEEVGDAVANGRNWGFRFESAGTGLVTAVEIDVASVTVAFDALARVFADAGGSPGAQIGEASDPSALDGTGMRSFAWSSDAPDLSADERYWVVFTDVTATDDGRVTVRTVADQGEPFASGKHDTIASIADGSGAVPAGADFKVAIVTRPAAARGVLELLGAASSVAVAGQAVAITEPGSRHLLAFVVDGLPGDKVVVRIGSVVGGADTLDDHVAGPGSHVVAFTPTVSSVHLQFRNEMAKTVRIDDVAIPSGTPVELATPFAADEAFALQLAQSADVLYLAHPDHPPHTLKRR